VKTFRFWLAVLLSISVHAVPLCALGGWIGWSRVERPAKPPVLLEAWGNSDREGFDVETVSLNPGVWRKGNENTPGGDNGKEKKEAEPAPLDEEPAAPLSRVEETPRPETPPPALMTSLAPAPARLPESTAKTGLPGAPGGADKPIGTPTKGGVVGVRTGVRELGTPQKTYPATALDNGWEGTPIVQLRISSEGKVIDVKLDKPCAHKVLNEAAVRFAWKMRFRPALDADDNPVEDTVLKPIEYKIISR
jgi:protein TonB